MHCYNINIEYLKNKISYFRFTHVLTYTLNALCSCTRAYPESLDGLGAVCGLGEDYWGN